MILANVAYYNIYIYSSISTYKSIHQFTPVISYPSWRWLAILDTTSVTLGVRFQVWSCRYFFKCFHAFASMDIQYLEAFRSIHTHTIIPVVRSWKPAQAFVGKTLGVRFQPSSVMLYIVSFYKCFHTVATYIPRFDGYIYKLSLTCTSSHPVSPVICGFEPAQVFVGNTLGVRFQVGSFRLQLFLQVVPRLIWLHTLLRWIYI